jgi:hypothetical protein
MMSSKLGEVNLKDRGNEAKVFIYCWHTIIIKHLDDASGGFRETRTATMAHNDEDRG